MQTVQSVQKLTPECQAALNEYLFRQFSGEGNNKTGSYIFRRAGKNINMRNPVYKKVTPDGIQILDNTDTITTDMMKKNGQIDCAEFYGYTTTHAIRKEFVRTLNVPILFRSQTYKQPNIGMPHASRLYEVITPLEGDLLCIWLSNETIRSCQDTVLEADAWFIASEQFLRAHTLILYDWHDSFKSLIPKNTPVEKREEALRRKLFIGNNLMTNGWLKHSLALDESELLPMEPTESYEKYWHLRSEPASRNWVDVYAALILMARYGEVPTSDNVPNTATGPQRTQWSLPPNFIKNFCLETIPIIPTAPVPEKPSNEINIQISIELPAITTTIKSNKPRAVDILFSIDWY